MSEITYNAAPTCAKFHQSDAFVRGIMGPIGCLEGNVEFLSPQGWLRMDEWNGHKVAVWDKDTESVRYEVPEYVKLPATKWYTFKSRTRFEMTMSEEHNMPTMKLSKKYSGEPTETFVDMNAKQLAKLEGRCRLFHNYTYPNRRNRLSEAEIRFAVAVNADGCIVKDSANTVQFGFVKERKIERMTQLLKDLGYHYTTYTYDCKKSSTGSYTTFRVKSPYLQKTFTGDYWWSMGGDELNVVMDEIYRWDGTVKGPDNTCKTLSTSREEDIPFIQHMAAASGYRATIGIEVKKSGKWKPNYVVNFIDRNSPKGSVNIRRSTIDVEERFAEPGEAKYCFTTSTGYFVIRVNNQVVISSNSGKSVACCMEIFRRACEQAPAPDGKRKSRWLVVRNTLPQLETTTIKTWVDWFPPNLFGRMTGKPPYTHHVNYGDVEMEVVFIALDKPEDVKKLLSFECTGIWFNEAREIRKEIIDAGTGRVGRYPSSKDGGCTWSGIIMDTNPPDDGHWWYKLSVEEVPTGWEFFKQPSGMDADGENLENHSQPASEILTKEEIELIGPERGITKKSEMDLEAKRAVGRRYYLRMMGGKTKEWLNVYVHGNFGYSQSGKAVFGAAWNPELHTIEDDAIDIQAYKDVIVGVDCSGRNPAAVFLQKDQYGCYQALHELVCQDLGATTFAQLLKAEVRKLCPTNNVEFWGDPAGTFKDQDDKTYVEILRGAGIFVRPAGSNRIPERLSAVENALLTMAGAPPKPRLRIHKRCKMLLAGMNGGYRFKQLNVSGEDRFDIKPDKNRFSDVQDGLQYGLLGGGEGNVMKQRKRANRGTISAKVDFNV